jgi:serine-type D-Ala-D-Ala carboxypeptidase/endopeptidase
MGSHRGRSIAALLGRAPVVLPVLSLLSLLTLWSLWTRPAFADASSIAGPATMPPDSVVQAIIDARAKFTPNAGIVVGLIDSRGRRVLSAGTVDGTGTKRPDGRSVFEIGSVTKTVTGTLLAGMTRRGEVRFEQPVAELLPDSVKVPSRVGKPITLLDLATQSSGLPRLPGNLSPKDESNPYADYSAGEMYAFLSSYSLTRDPGAEYEYSNLGMGLLGFALARHAGMPYEDLVIARIAQPLNITDTRIALTPDERARLAPGHDIGGKTVANWDLPTLAGAGALRSTVNDMLVYVAACMSADTTTDIGRDLLTATTPLRGTTIPNMRIGLAWHVREADDMRIVWHNGGTGGYHAFIGFDRARSAGIVILANSVVNTDDIGLHVLDPAVPITPPTPPKQHKEVALKPEQMEPCVGRYELAPGAIITVTLDQAQLSVQLTGQPAFPIFPESDGHFFLKVVEATLDFERDAEGRVISLTLHQNGQDIRAPRVEEGK